MEKLVWVLGLSLFAACSKETKNDTASDSQEETDTPRDTGERDPVRDLDPDSLPDTAAPCRAPELVYVKEVYDGDTIKVEGKWGG